MYDLAIIGGELYIEGNYVSKNLYIKEGKINKISKELFKSKESYDAKGKKVFPGFIDPHVHFELGGGKFRSRDDFYSGSVSAAYGGITTFIDFLDPVATAMDLEDALNNRLKLAEKSVIDYAFHATIKNPKNQVVPIVKAMKRLNLSSIKLFTTYSESNRRTHDAEISQLIKLSKENGFLVLAHIEDDDLIDLNKSYKVADLPISRRSEAELKEALKLAGFTKDFDGKLYMVHLSSGKTLEALKKYYPDILNKDFFVESCPHYFTFTSEKYYGEKGHLFTMAPPLRTEAELSLLKESFDYINTIGTDHCSFMKEEKRQKRLVDIPMGIGGVEHSFNIMYSLFKEKVIDKMTINTAKIYGLYPRKGALIIGGDADIVIYDSSKKHVIGEDHSASDNNIYKGQTVCGQIETTISRGQFIIKKGILMGGRGQYIRKR